MQKSFEIEQGGPEIWGFKGLGMILLRETKKRGKYHCAGIWITVSISQYNYDAFHNRWIRLSFLIICKP